MEVQVQREVEDERREMEETLKREIDEMREKQEEMAEKIRSDKQRCMEEMEPTEIMPSRDLSPYKEPSRDCQYLYVAV